MNTTHEKSPLLKISEAAEMLNVNPTTVLRWIERGHVKAIRYPSGSYRMERAQIERLLHQEENSCTTYRIMVIDDEPLFLESIKTMLEAVDLPLDVTTYANELDALIDITAIKPHVIIIDYLLASIDGATIAEKIRQRPGLEAIPLILVSGKIDAPPKHEKEADVFLRKPFSVDALEQALKRVLKIQE